ATESWREKFDGALMLWGGDRIVFDSPVTWIAIRTQARYVNSFVPYDKKGKPIPAASVYKPDGVILTPERPATLVECKEPEFLLLLEVCFITLAEQQKADAASKASAQKQAALSAPAQTQPDVRP